MAFSHFPYRREDLRAATWEDGPLLPMPKVKTPRQPRSSVSGRSTRVQEDSIDRIVDWCTKTKSDVSPRKSALDKGTAAGGYDLGPMKMFKDEIFPTGRGEPRVPPEVYKAISDSIQACQLSGADPKQTAEQGAQIIDSFLAGYTGAPLL